MPATPPTTTPWRQAPLAYCAGRTVFSPLHPPKVRVRRRRSAPSQAPMPTPVQVQ